MGQRIDYTEPMRIENEAQKYLNEIYKEKGFETLRVKGIENKKGDIYLIKENCKWLVEEKSASYYAPYMPFEEHQNFPEWDGWIFYTKADAIVYFYFNKYPSPYICYFVEWQRAKRFYEKLRNEWREYRNTKYKGDTRGVLIPWDELLKWGMCQIIFKRKDSV